MKKQDLRRIVFSLSDITDLEIAEVADALSSGWITSGLRINCWRED